MHQKSRSGIGYRKPLEVCMKSFKNYGGGGKSDGQGFPKEGTAADLTRKIAQAYDGKSGAEMWQSILAEAEKSKRAGTLSNEEIDEFYRQFAPILNDFQRKQLTKIVNRLKSI